MALKRRRRAPDGSFPRSPHYYRVIEAGDLLKRRGAAMDLVHEAVPKVKREELLRVRTRCLDAASAAGEKETKEACLELIDLTTKVQRQLRVVLKAMDEQGASPERRMRFPAGSFPPLLLEPNEPEAIQARLGAANAVRAMAAAVDNAAAKLRPMRAEVAAMAKADNLRAAASQLAFAKRLVLEVAGHRRLELLLTGGRPYFLAVACGVEDLPSDDARCQKAIDSWKKRIDSAKRAAAGKNSAAT